MTARTGAVISEQTFGETVADAFGVPFALAADGKWYRADASDPLLSLGDVALCIETSVAADGTGSLLKYGYIQRTGWTWTLGQPVYFGATPGTLTQTKPAGNTIRYAGYPAAADALWFSPTDPVLAEYLSLELPTGTEGDYLYHNGVAWVPHPVDALPTGTFGDTLFHDGTDWVARSTAPIIGVEWDTTSTSPTLTWIDELGNPITALPPGFFDSHPVWGGRWRCTRDRTTGQITFGSNARGDGLTLDGTAGDVLVREPAFWSKHEYDPVEGLVRWWVSPRPSTGFALHPYYYMRGGGFPAANMFCGAYEAYGYLDETFKLGSATGKTPITGGVAYPDLPNSGRLTIDDAELYAQNAGMSGITSFWGDCARMLLMYIEYGTFDIQTALGAGVVDMASGSGFAGVNTGADGIDSRLAANGTGVGSGTDGLTPVCWRGIENPYGNAWKFVIGANFSLDGTFRLIKRDGTGTLAGTLPAGSYESGSGVPIVDGSISGLIQGDLEGLAFVPAAAAGSTATYLCDNWWYPRGANYILLAGGAWNVARCAGPGCRNAGSAVSGSNRAFGARVEFRPAQGV